MKKTLAVLLLASTAYAGPLEEKKERCEEISQYKRETCETTCQQVYNGKWDLYGECLNSCIQANGRRLDRCESDYQKAKKRGG